MDRPATEASAGNAERDRLIDEFVRRQLDGENSELYRQMLVTLCRLRRDGAARGDVKLIQKALAELRFGLKTFAPYREIRKISIFGSARTPEDHPNYQAAIRFARRMSDNGWMVITGAGDGIMKAGHGGAGRQASFGVAIRLPFEQKTNEIIADDSKLVNFRYFFTRKLMFIKEASAVALFPGGFGTLDEGFEALTLVQTGKAELAPIVMLEAPGGTYWPHWKRYVTDELLRTGMISPADMNLFFVTDDVEAAVQEILTFYRVYHSARYVNDDLVLRLQHALSDATIAALNDEFAAELVSQGRIWQSLEPLAEENGQAPNLPRLVLRFNRKNVGVLRRLIDRINRFDVQPRNDGRP